MPVTQLDPIPSTKTLGSVVCDRLRAAIMSGEFAPGERLSEGTIAAQLQVSRSPVREAIQRLEAERLVERRANYGSYVWVPTAQDIDEIVSLRITCECLAAEWAMPRLNGEDFAFLARLIEEQRRAAEEGDTDRFRQSDLEFHDYVVRRAGHSRLTEWWEHISAQMKVLHQLRWQSKSSGMERNLEIVVQHAALLDAFKRGDLEAVLSLHRRSNLVVREEMKAVLPGERVGHKA